MSTNETDNAAEPTEKRQSIFELFKTDEDAEERGIRLDYGEAGWLLCGRAGGANRRYTRRVEQLQRKYKRKIDHGLLRDEEARAELYRIFADTIVFDGELVKPDGEVVKVKGNKEAVIWFFEKLPALFDDVREAVSNIDLFLEAQRETEAGN